MLRFSAPFGLKKHDMVTPKHDRPRGVLNVTEEAPRIVHARFWPSVDLAPFVEHYWLVEWDVQGRSLAEVLPHPCVHLVLERGRSMVGGPAVGRFTRVLEGKGRVLGTKFRPGGFRPFVDVPVSTFTGRASSPHAIFGAAALGLEERALAHVEAGHALQAMEEVERFLRRLAPTSDASVELASRIASRIATDRALTKVDHVATAFGMGTRQLQRLFSAYVGVSPKWVLQRYRLHEAAERMTAASVADWADLALELGYADQAHFIRDFKKAVGRSPAAYASRLRSPPGTPSS